MHPRNAHKDGYNFKALVKSYPALAQFVITNPSGKQSIDFAKPHGVKALNAALLKHYYKINSWDIPTGYLFPPVPGRADYIHALYDLLARDLDMDNTPINGLDIGTGANLIYPIIGSQSYGWTFVGSDVDQLAVKSAQLIASNNTGLSKMIKLRHQPNRQKIFEGVIKPNDKFTFAMCNPPFHASKKAALKGSVQKNANLQRHQNKHNPITKLQQPENMNTRNTSLNFAGQDNELYCVGGEVGFIERMMRESVDYKKQVTWFTSLVSKKESLRALKKQLELIDVADSTIVNMTQGNKVSRFIAWRY
jgi:23S rRNA (adenine1618-N6)-methyltransferase